MRFDTDILHLDNDTITRVAQPLNNNLMIQFLSLKLFLEQLKALMT